MTSALTFLLGGARSGKSALAVRLASTTLLPVTVVATGEARDEEMAARIRAHRAGRPASWTTIEEPLDLRGALDAIGAEDCVIVDCLSLWVSNLLEAGVSAEVVVAQARDSATALAARRGSAFGVGNEVGLGLVPMDPLGRLYRDTLGRVNVAWAEAAERSLLVVAGRALPLLDAAELPIAP